MAELVELQNTFNRHPLIVQARLDGYDIAVCPFDGDIYISVPEGTNLPDGQRSDDLMEHPETRGKGCAKPEEPYKALKEVFEDLAVLPKLLETLNAEKAHRDEIQAKSTDSA